MMSIRASFVLLVVVTVPVFAACGSSKECKLQDGTYALKLTKTGGSCPDVPDQTFTQPDTSPGSEAGCHLTVNNTMCSGQISCKEMDATSTTRVSGSATLGTGSTLNGSMTVTVTNNDASPGCTGTYTFTATKR